MVEEYRLARYSQVMQESERTHEAQGEQELERQNFVKAPITFREWLEGIAQSREDGAA